MKGMLASLVKMRMYHDPALCIHAVVDAESSVYNITKVWNDESGFLSDVHPDYTTKRWSKEQKQGINVTAIPFTKTHIAYNELNNDEFLRLKKNKILQFVYHSKYDGDKSKKINSKRQKIIKQFGGKSFKTKSLKKFRSRKEMQQLLKLLQSKDSDIRLIVVFIELKWIKDKHKLSLKPRKNDENECSVLLTLFISYKNQKNDNEITEQKEEEKYGIILKCCLLTSRDTWVKQNYQPSRMHQLYYEMLHFNQFWLHLMPEIADYWCHHYSSHKKLHHLPLNIPSKHITFFYEKYLKIYEEANEDDSYLQYMHRKHFVLTCEIPVIVDDNRVERYFEQDELEESNDQEPDEDFTEIGVECIDGIFNKQDIKYIMNDIHHYLQNEKTTHFALEYKLHEYEKNIIKEKHNNMLSMYSKYIHEPETYELYNNEEKQPYSTSESDSDSFTSYDNPYLDSNIIEKQQIYSPQVNKQFIQKHSLNQIAAPGVHVQHIPIPHHFQQPLLPDNNHNDVTPKKQKKKNHKIKEESDNDGSKPPDLDLFPANTSKDMYLQSLKPGSVEYFEENVKRSMPKYKKLVKKVRERELTKLMLNDLNGIAMRCFIHEHEEKININVTNKLPTFWTDIIKPKLLRFGMDKIAKYYQFAFVFESFSNCTSFNINIAKLKCKDTDLHFQNSELTLMVFCMETCIIYSEVISLIIKPGRIYTFEYDVLGEEFITICNNEKKCFVLILRTSPLIDITGYKWFDVNGIYESFEPIELHQDYYEMGQMDAYDDINDGDMQEYEMEEEIEQQNTNIKNKKNKQIYSANLMSQTVKVCAELKMDSKEFADDVSLKKIEDGKTLINKGLDIPDFPARRRYFDKLMKKREELCGEIYFYIGNQFELQGNYVKAIKYYEMSLNDNRKNKKYLSTKTMNHICQCIKEINDEKIKKIDDELILLMEESWRNAASSEDKYCQVRKEWVIFGDVEEQLAGAAQCALNLSRYYEDSIGKCNDQSLIWYKRSLNIFEGIKVVVVNTVGINELIDSFNDDRHILLLKEQNLDAEMHIERKRLFVHFTPRCYLRTAEGLIQSYMQCLLERFLATNYEKNVSDISNYQCFEDFKQNENKYSADFDKYLQMELDSMFEMNHHLFLWPKSYIQTGCINIADVYINYATFLLDGLKQYKNAELWYEKSLEHNQCDPTTYWNMAEMYEHMFRWKEAEQYYDFVLRFTPTIPKEDYEKAKNDVETAKQNIQQKKHLRRLRCGYDR